MVDDFEKRSAFYKLSKSDRSTMCSNLIYNAVYIHNYEYGIRHAYSNAILSYRSSYSAKISNYSSDNVQGNGEGFKDYRDEMSLAFYEISEPSAALSRAFNLLINTLEQAILDCPAVPFEQKILVLQYIQNAKTWSEIDKNGNNLYYAIQRVSENMYFPDINFRGTLGKIYPSSGLNQNTHILLKEVITIDNNLQIQFKGKVIDL